MKFDDPEVVESICYQMRMAEYPRGKNRALINNLFNGFPPYTEQEEEDSNIEINVNFLEGTRLSHEARSQFYQSMLKPGNYFTSRCDMGPVHKREEWGRIVTAEISKVMKRSMVYTESMRSKIASNVLHGISPASWRDKYRWCPSALGVEDVFVPGNTLLTMENLPFFAIYRSMTAPEMVRLFNSGRLDPAWNRQMLKSAIKWVDKESQTLMYNNWPEVWSPEKTAERVKGDGGFYYGDQVPTINVFDFYFWNDSGNSMGWNRRMILDAWSTPQDDGSGNAASSRRKGKLYDNYRRKFLYDPKDRKVSQSISEIINWQFADLSAVAPFRYHSVRSLGYLLYSICHLQNRLRCRFNESVFEQLMIYFRINTDQDMQRSLKVDLANRGFIDDSVKFIPPAERYQVNTNLAMLGLQQNSGLIAQNSASFTTQNQRQDDRREKTKFEVMSEVNAMTTLVSTALAQAYMYQAIEYREIARRFMIRNSPDPEVRQVQSNCLKRGVSEKVIYNPSCWDHEPERVMGAGNKTLELAIAEQLMQYRNLFDPEPQREILRDVVLAVTDNPDKANSLVPENPIKITDSVHDAQLAAGTLMQGLPVAIKTGINHIEYADAMVATINQMVQVYLQSQQIPTQDKLMGMFNMIQHVGQHIQIIAQDKNEKQRVKQYQDTLGGLANALKGFAQQVAEQQQAAQGAQGGDRDTEAKIQAQLITAQAKAQNTRESHAQRTAQRQIQFEREQERKDVEFSSDLQRRNLQAAQELEISKSKAQIALEKERASAAQKAKKVDSE